MLKMFRNFISPPLSTLHAVLQGGISVLSGNPEISYQDFGRKKREHDFVHADGMVTICLMRMKADNLR